MTFQEILTALYSDCRVGSSPGAEIVSVFKRYVNTGHKNVLIAPNLSGLRDGTLTFSSVANQKFYAFPNAFERINFLVDTTNNRKLVNKTRDWFRSIDPGEKATGTPWAWIDGYLSPVAVQPNATGLWVVSSSAVDTVLTVHAKVIRVGGYQPAPMSGVLNGVTRVQMLSGAVALTDIVQITSFSIAGVSAGEISLFDASVAGTLLATIPATSVQYAQSLLTRLWPTASSVNVYTVDGRFKVPALVNNDDVPMLPESFHDLPMLWAKWLWAKDFIKDGQWAKDTKTEIDERLGVLRSFVEFPNGYSVRRCDRLDAMRWSDLGPWFPADSPGLLS